MEFVYTGLVSVAVAVLTFIINNLIKENHKLKQERDNAMKARDKALEDGVVCLLRVKLIEYHTEYTNACSISLHGYENWILMYRAYKALGGNGMVEHMKDNIEDLKMKSGR